MAADEEEEEERWKEQNERKPVFFKDKETKRRIYFAFKNIKGTPSSALE